MSAQAPGGGGRPRLATVNIQHGLGADGTAPDPVRLERALASLDADVLALQEVDRSQPRSGGVDQAALVARATGLPWFRFAPTLLGDVRSIRDRTPVTRPAVARAAAPPTDAAASPPAGGDHGPAYGVALLSRYPVLAWFVAPLPGPRGRQGAHDGLRRSGRLGRPRPTDGEPRVCLAAVVRTPWGLLVAASTHLTRAPRVAIRQLDVGLRGLDLLAARSAAPGAEPPPSVLLGDLNLRPGPVDACARRCGAVRALAVAPTHPAAAPARQVDHVLGRGAVHPHGPASTPRLAVSDHRPLVVDVWLDRS